MPSNTVLAIIQARTGSTRLPGKVLLDLAGKSALEHVIERMRCCRLVDDFIVATTISRQDLSIVNLCAELGVRVYCGSEEDPLERYFQAARLFGGDHIIRIKADCPAIDPNVVDQAFGCTWRRGGLHHQYGGKNVPRRTGCGNLDTTDTAPAFGATPNSIRSVSISPFIFKNIPTSSTRNTSNGKRTILTNDGPWTIRKTMNF